MRCPAVVLLALAVSLEAAAATPPAAQALPDPVARLLAAAPYSGLDVGLFAADAARGAPLAAAAPDVLRTAASTAKVFTTACALDSLGAARRFRTTVLAESRPDADGVLHGNVYLRGGGDPLLRAEDAWALTRDLAARGLRRVTGDLVADDTLFEPGGWPASWGPPDAIPAAPYAAPQGALAIGWDSVEVVVLPGAAEGQPARVTLEPLAAGARLAVRALTAARTDLAIDAAAAPDGTATVTVSGTIARSAEPYTAWVHLGPPTRVALDAFAELFAGAGIDVAGRGRPGRTPHGAVTLAERESPPLGTLVAEINKPSSNFGAEMLLRGLAAAAGEAPATVGGGLAALGRCLERWGIPRDAVQLVDGSGLGRANRVTPRALVRALLAARASAAWGPEFLASLPRAAEDGSLRRRFPALAGRLRAKTGTIDGALALAGYAVPRGGREIAFAVLLGQRHGGPAPTHAALDRLAEALVEALGTPR